MPPSAIQQPFQLLEVKVVSAVNLARVCRNMRTYAVAWVHPERKLSTRVDTRGHTKPTWDDKFLFRVEHDFLSSYMMVDIYAQHWFKDLHVGTVCVLLATLLPDNNAGMQFVAVQVRRRSGRPQGIMNIGVSVLGSSISEVPQKNNDVEKGAVVPRLRRTRSDTNSMVSSEVVARQKNMLGNDRSGSVVLGSSGVGFMTKNRKSSSMVNVSEAGKKKKKASSTVNGIQVISKGKKGKARSMISASFKRRKGRAKSKAGSIINGSQKAEGSMVMARQYMTDSELGPSASEVAAYRRRTHEAESEILGTWYLNSSEKGLKTKVERWRKEMYYQNIHGYEESEVDDDFEGRGCSCFSKICGLECSIVCGVDPKKRNSKNMRHRRSFSESESYT